MTTAARITFVVVCALWGFTLGFAAQDVWVAWTLMWEFTEMMLVAVFLGIGGAAVAGGLGLLCSIPFGVPK